MTWRSTSTMNMPTPTASQTPAAGAGIPEFSGLPDTALLEQLAGDELVDVFPGSGGIGRAWSDYTRGVA